MQDLGKVARSRLAIMDEQQAHSEPQTPAPPRWPLRRKIKWLVGTTVSVVVGGTLFAGAAILFVLIKFGQDLPDYRQLASYEPPVMTRVHAADGSLLTEYARQKRLFVPIDAIPAPVIEAFLAAEDKNFYTHAGFDYLGIVRAAVTNVFNAVRDRRPVGASTITQQVAKNFLLSGEVSYERKLKEAILAFRIERAFSKDQILELYLNEIYLGAGSYGVAAAALNYFDKALDELTVTEAAYLAALPKAPSNYHPVRRHAAAVARRNWVLSRMRVLDHITREDYAAAVAEPLEVRGRRKTKIFRADYFEEGVRRELYRVYGERKLYDGGLSVRTSLEPRLQAIAETALRRGLVAYDRRHGWRGVIARIQTTDDWAERLATVDQPLGIDSWRLATVLELRRDGAVVGMEGPDYGFIPFQEMTWARPWRRGERLGPKVTDVSDVLELGDVIAVEPLADTDASVEITTIVDALGEPIGAVPPYGLRQVPDVEGALVALDPHTGRVLAMVGGFDYRSSEFNRAVQADRQPGSAFKPFVYAAALAAGMTPSSLVLDAPFVIDQGAGQGKWKPRNSSNRFYGPSTLRLGLEKSRNLMTVRLAQHLGMDRVVAYADRFRLAEHMEPTLAMALGAGEVTLLDLTTAYAMLVNGGKAIRPTLIDRIQDRRGHTIFRNDQRPCEGCLATQWQHQPEPELPDERQQIIDPRVAFQTVNMLQGVVQNGTGRRIRALGRPLAGKTGTTNEAADTWFVGFSPDLAVGVFVGFDRPRSLGAGEEGSSVAVPIFKDFMEDALKGEPIVPFRIASGVRLVRVDHKSGLPAQPGDRNVVLEAFIPGTEPRPGQTAVLDGADRLVQTKDELATGTGGLY